MNEPISVSSDGLALTARAVGRADEEGGGATCVPPSYSPGVARFLQAAVPSLGALFFFAIGVRALVHADRRERAAAARYEREQGMAQAAGAASSVAPGDAAAPPKADPAARD